MGLEIKSATSEDRSVTNHILHLPIGVTSRCLDGWQIALAQRYLDNNILSGLTHLPVASGYRNQFAHSDHPRWWR
jgi:hypothetical protein